MRWAQRLAKTISSSPFLPSSRNKRTGIPHTRRVLVEPLEDRCLLSVAGTSAAEYDFGDLPDNYGTTLAADGARHQAIGPTLGATRDADPDGLPSFDATGDDASGCADEDGLTFGAIRVGQLDATVTLNVQNAPSGAKLDAWVDFNRDGSFCGAGEQIADSVSVVEGNQVFQFDVPSWTLPGNTYARFRVSTAGNLAATGTATDGEVEDHRLVITTPTPASGIFAPHNPLTGQIAGPTDVVPADVDGDGDMDLLTASSDDDAIVWHENDGNERFTMHTIATSADGARSVCATDLDGDGDMDVLSASYSDDKIAWYENDGEQNFLSHTISVSADGANSVAAADLDGDGDLDVLSTSCKEDKIVWYENDGEQTFTTHTIITAPDGGYSALADVDGDGDMDVLSASPKYNRVAWHENDGNENFTAHLITNSAEGAHSVFAADVDSDGDMDVLSASYGDDTIAWYENDGREAFTTHTIAATADGAESVFAADVDGDGDIDVLSASHLDGRIAWYENDGEENFTTRTISASAEGANTVWAVDLDGDDDMDVLSVSIYDCETTWYENDGDELFTPHAITTSANEATSVFAADVDGDGDMDAISASSYDNKIAWYENDGEDAFTPHTIVTYARGAESVFAADLDGDGDTDVLSASFRNDLIAWYENDGSENFSIHTITASANGACSVHAADIDGDGDMDVLSASYGDDTIAWYENDGDADFTAHTITTSADGARSVFSADLDGDGDVDVLSASWRDRKITWYENYGRRAFIPRVIAISDGNACFVSAADVDADGDMDVFAASYYDNKIAWYENDGRGDFSARAFATSASSIDSVFIADGDGDGDMDVFSASRDDDRIAWHGNDGDENFVEYTISTSVNGPRSIHAADMDSDGDLDMLGASFFDDKIVWWENLLRTDFGDAPDNYGTTLSSDGARHHAIGPTLGATRDADADGLPTPTADGDDTNATADEDGILFENAVAVGQYFSVVFVNVQDAPNGAKLDAWIDYNHNGSFDHAEQIFDSIDVTEGLNRIMFNVPESALPGETYARFRLSTSGNLDPTGLAQDGEVEDYQLTIEPKGLEIATEELGEIDYIPTTRLSYYDHSYAFTSARDGYVTIEARVANIYGEPFGNPVALILRDSEGNVLQESETRDSYVRIDHLDANGDNDYVLDIVAQRGYSFPAIPGGSPKIYLRICNLVSPSGTNVDVFGTSESDSFSFTLSDAGNVSVNDIEYSFDASQLELISFIDQEGSDQLTISGIWGNESAQLVPGAVDFQADGIDLRLHPQGIEHLTVNAGGGYLFEMIDGADNDTFGSIMAGRTDASVTVNAPFAPSGTKLDAWIDFDGNGSFEPSEQIAAAHDLADGDNRIEFEVPDSAVAGQTFVRFRMSADGNLTPDGAAIDGDTDDYAITILPVAVDFADAPESYGTTQAADGARHNAIGPMLGASRDTETDGLPTVHADGDDTDATADEDGVYFENAVAVGEYFSVVLVNVQDAPNGAKLDAWIDYNRNGSFDSDEQIADSVDVTEGLNRIMFNVPESALPGETYARFRLSTAGNLDPTGPAVDGEIEDYQLTIEPKGPEIATEELGKIDYKTTTRLSYLDRSYAFISARDGYVTIEANIANVFGEPFSNPVALILRDSEGNVLQESESSDSYVRIDYLDPSGDNDYTLDIDAQHGYSFSAVLGGSPKIYLRICNLVSPSGPNVEVFGTSESDTFDFAMSDTGSVSVNDIDYSFDASQTDLVSFIDQGGSDKLTVGGVWGDESAQLVPGAVDFQAGGIDLRVQPQGVEHITVNAGGGYLLEMSDTSDDDTFGLIVAGEVDASVTVNAPFAPSGTKLDAWIDFNGNGSFEPSEQIAAAHELSDGDNRIEFDVPGSAVAGRSFVRFRTSTDGNLTPDGATIDGDTDDYQITITAKAPDTPTLDLGAIDYRVLPGLDLSAGPKAYSFSTWYGGYLTVDVTLDSAGGEATLRLIAADEILGEVATENGYARLDHLDLTPGTAFTVQVMGTNPNVDLRLCNLFGIDGRAAHAHGTDDGDDEFEYVGGPTIDLTINGLGYQIDRTAFDTLDIDGAGDGIDRAVLTGSTATEFASLSPRSASLLDPFLGFNVSVANMAHIAINGGGGADVAELNDSAGNDTLTATPDQMVMTGPVVDGRPYSLTANNFRYAHGYAKNGGIDTAKLTGSENKDRVKPYTDFVKLIGSGFFNRTKFFETITVDTLGGTDNGVMIPASTPDAVWAMKNDIRIARDITVPAGQSPDYDNLTYDVTIANCEYFLARAAGNDDWLELHDSPGNDVLLAKPHKIQIMNGPNPDAGTDRGSEYKYTARGFYHMASIADQGGDNDSAKLYDSAEDGVDVWAAAYVDGETWSTMTSPTRLLYEVLAFEHVGGYGYNGGLGEDHGTNRKDHADDVDFVFQYGYWEET